MPFNLTLTRVVFESKEIEEAEGEEYDLTLTRVVFEYYNTTIKY